jgi:hypothetical protein
MRVLNKTFSLNILSYKLMHGLLLIQYYLKKNLKKQNLTILVLLFNLLKNQLISLIIQHGIMKLLIIINFSFIQYL